MSLTSSESHFSLALPDDIKKMKEYDGCGNIPIFPQFASDMIRSNALRLDAKMDVSSWLALKGKIMGRAKPDVIASAMYNFCRLLRDKFAGALFGVPLADRTGTSEAETVALASLWDSETIEALAKLWDISYNKRSLALVATFFDRPGGPCPSAEELSSLTKPALSAYLASLGMCFMAPAYANGLVDELLDRRSSSSRACSSTDPIIPAYTADLGSYQVAFTRAVLLPSDAEFERAYERAFAPVEESSAPSLSTIASIETPSSAPRSVLQQFMDRRVPAPPPKKFKSDAFASLSSQGVSLSRVQPTDIRGSVNSQTPLSFDVSPLSGLPWSASPASALPSMYGAGFPPSAGNFNSSQVDSLILIVRLS